jgi:hypothetical protein
MASLIPKGFQHFIGNVAGIWLFASVPIRSQKKDARLPRAALHNN